VERADQARIVAGLIRLEIGEVAQGVVLRTVMGADLRGDLFGCLVGALAASPDIGTGRLALGLIGGAKSGAADAASIGFGIDADRIVFHGGFLLVAYHFAGRCV